MRMANVATFLAAKQWNMNERIDKPFISVLGETYELVTDKFKFLGECVWSSPCVLATHCKGERFECNKTCESKMFFRGTYVEVIDKRPMIVTLTLKDGSKEEYRYVLPPVVVGNLVIGSKFIES